MQAVEMLPNYATLLNLLHCLGLDLQHSFAHLAACENQELTSFPEGHMLILQRDNLVNATDLLA
jgi:hypothetical protein